MSRSWAGAFCVAIVLASRGAAAETKVDIVDFIDNTEKYEGKTLTLKLAWYRGRAVPKNLREMAGYIADFRGRGPKGENLRVQVKIPEGIKAQVVKASDGDKVLVTFKCEDGKLGSGNIAISIKRP